MEQPYVIAAGIRAVEHAIELFSESIQDTGYVDSKLEDNARVLMDLLEFHQGYNAFHHLCSDKGQLVMDTSDGDVVVVDEAYPVYCDEASDTLIREIINRAKENPPEGPKEEFALRMAEMAEKIIPASDEVALDQEEIERLWPSDRR